MSNSTSTNRPSLTPEELAAQSDLIAVGEYIGNDRLLVAEGDGAALDVGVIQLESILKGETGRTIALLFVPPARRGTPGIELEAGQRGLWYLEARASGLFAADRPERFVPMAKAAARIQSLKGSPAPRPANDTAD